MKYVIRFIGAPRRYVFGFNARGQGVVATTDSIASAKRFPTIAKANAFIAKYADAGYGMQTSGVEVLPHNGK